MTKVTRVKSRQMILQKVYFSTISISILLSTGIKLYVHSSPRYKNYKGTYRQVSITE